MWLHEVPKHDHKKPQFLDYWMKDAEVDKIKVNTSNVPQEKKYTKINNFSSSVLNKSKSRGK
jgi:hypothetical protein